MSEYFVSKRTEHLFIKPAESDERDITRNRGTILPGQDKIYPRLRTALYPLANYVFGRYDGPTNSPNETIDNFQEDGR
jgi:hypothetical protein